MRNLSIPFKLRLSLIIVIGAACLKTPTWSGLAVYAGLAFGWAIALRVPIKTLFKLLGSELLLLTIIAFPQGWERASFLLLRSLVCLLTMNSFLLTLPPHSFAIALQGLPLPSAFKEILLLAGQYLEILLSEVNQMQRAAQCRGLSGAAGWLRYTSASMIGALYLRSLQRSERVYNAMLLRGYQGTLPNDNKFTPKETAILIVLSLIAASITISSYLKF